MLQPLHSAASWLPWLLSLPQQQQLGQDGHLPADPGLGQGPGVAGAAGAGQATEEVGAAQRGGRRVVGAGKDVRVDGVYADIMTSLQEQLQTGLAVGGEDERLDAPALPLDPDSRQMRKNESLKRGEGSLQRRESRGGTRGDGDRALRGDANAILGDGQLGDLALASSVVQDEERQAGVAEQAPGLGGLQLPGQRQEGRVLEPTEVQDQRGQRGQEGQHVVTA